MKDNETLRIGNIVEVKSTHKGTFTALYEVTELLHIYNRKATIATLKLIAGQFYDWNCELGEKKVYTECVRKVNKRALTKIAETLGEI